MIIINQDKDELKILSTKDIFYKKHFATIRGKRLFMGWNIYGQTEEGKELLGTFDSHTTCQTVIAEIKQHETAGMTSYTIPEEADDLEEVDADV